MPACRAEARVTRGSVTSPPRRNPNFQRARLEFEGREPKTSRNFLPRGPPDPRAETAPGSNSRKLVCSARLRGRPFRPDPAETLGATRPFPTGARHSPAGCSAPRGLLSDPPPSRLSRPEKLYASSKSFIHPPGRLFFERRLKYGRSFSGPRSRRPSSRRGRRPRIGPSRSLPPWRRTDSLTSPLDLSTGFFENPSRPPNSKRKLD